MPPQSDSTDPTKIDTPPSLSSSAPTVRASTNLVGRTLGGRYLVEQELGRGGMGAVYLARDKPEMLSRRVVIKVLLEDSLKDEWVVKKFRQEIESLTRLHDPGVVGIFDAGTLEDGSPYLVMEFVEGANLRATLKPEGMDFERAANIIKQIGRTLTTAHDQGIVHRDLKPENIMLRTTTGGEDQIKVIDFGIAKVKNSAIAPTTLTGVSTAGTVAYMSPEQLAARSIAAASDIYALGVISYEMLTGRRPFNPETSFQLAEMQKQGVQVSSRALRPAIPEGAEKIILKALSYRPAERPQRARDFGDELAGALMADDFATAPFDPEEERSTVRKRPDTRPGTRPPVPLWMIAALGLLAVGLIATLVWRKAGSGSSTQPSGDQTTNIPTAPQRTLVYSLTVQKMDGERPLGDEFESTGQEIFGDGWKFRVNITPAQSGSLYMLNEFNGSDGAVNYNVLFPTPKNNNGVAQLPSDRPWQTGWYFFDNTPGTDKFRIIWSAQPLPELDAIFRDAAAHELVISDPGEVGAVRRVLGLYDSSQPEVVIDKANKRITLKGKSDVLVSLLELEHRKY